MSHESKKLFIAVNPRSEHFLTTCMDFWTNIDLIRAIHTTQEQKMEFLQELIDYILLMYKKYDTVQPDWDQEKLGDLISVLEEILISFTEVFQDLEFLPCYITCCFILNKLITMLKYISDVES